MQRLIICSICGKEKEIALGRTCKKCINKRVKSNFYKKRGIILDFDKYMNTYSSIEWYEFMYNGIINSIPIEISNKKNWIDIFRYVVLDKCNLIDRKDIKNIDSIFISKYKLTTTFSKIDNKIYNILNICFPELKLKPWELKVTPLNYFKDDSNKIKAIDWLLETTNLTINNLTKDKINIEKLFCNNGLSSLLIVYFKGSNIIQWYCEQKGISYSKHELKHKRNGYWKSIDNFNYQIKRYIEFLTNNNMIHDYKSDLPKLFTKSFLENTDFRMIYKSNKLYKHYDSIPHAVCYLFPKFNLTINDFIPIGIDNKTRLNSFEEKKVFDFIYDELGIKNIKSTGLSKRYKYVNSNHNEHYYPDFIIEGLLNKPIVIEYYGLYDLNHKENSMISNYIEKTNRKNNYYKNNDSIYYVDLYPNDLNNNYNGIKNKLNNILIRR